MFSFPGNISPFEDEDPMKIQFKYKRVNKLGEDMVLRLS